MISLILNNAVFSYFSNPFSILILPYKANPISCFTVSKQIWVSITNILPRKNNCFCTGRKSTYFSLSISFSYHLFYSIQVKIVVTKLSSSRSQIFFKSFGKFPEKHLYQSLFLNKGTDLRLAAILKKTRFFVIFIIISRKHMFRVHHQNIQTSVYQLNF